jgi:hypothetical protein
VTRTIRERPRLAAITALGLACLVALGLALGLLLGGGDDSGSESAAAAQEQRAAALELESKLDAANARAAGLEQAAARQRSRAQVWRERALRAEQRRALRRALTQEQPESD